MEKRKSFLEVLCHGLEKFVDEKAEEEKKLKGKTKMVEEEIPSEDIEIIPHIEWVGLDVSQYFKKLQIKDVFTIIEKIEESKTPLIN